MEIFSWNVAFPPTSQSLMANARVDSIQAVTQMAGLCTNNGCRASLVAGMHALSPFIPHKNP